MATIVKRSRKSGIAFLFQTKVTNPLTGEKLVKTETWNPPKGYTAKQAEREAAILADTWETQIKATYNVFNPNGTLTPDSTFDEVAEKWLEKLDKQFSENHYEESKDYWVRIISPQLGKFKIGKISQGIIQNFFDWLDNRVKVTRKVRSKPTAVRAQMKLRDETYTSLIRAHGLCSNTVQRVLNAKDNVSYEFAIKFTDVLKTDIHQLFDVQEKAESYAYNTNHHIKCAVRSILSFAKKRRIVQDNYATAEYIDYPKQEQEEIVCMDEESVKKAYRAIGSYKGDIRHATALLIAILTGFRKGEICALRWDSIDLENMRITVNLSVVRVKNRGVIERDPKTKQSKRTIEIPYILNAHLKRYKEWYYNKKSEMGDRWDERDWVFTNIDTGKRVCPNSILKWVNKVTESSGLGHWTVHSYRHTNITTKLLNNVPLIEVSGDAGHSRPSTTTDKYGHYLSKHKRQGPSVLDNIMAGSELTLLTDEASSKPHLCH